MFYPFESRMQARITVRRERLLPQQGEVLARTGDTVAAVDVIGRTSVGSRWRYIDVASQLGIAPDKVETCLTKRVGDSVEKGEVIASIKGGLGLFRRVCKSPATGVIATLHAGRVLIEEEGEGVELRALLRGKVAGVMSNYGAVIETKGALIKAAWGAGPAAYGVLKLVTNDRAAPLQAGHIDIGCHGAIIVAGWCNSGDTLRQAEQMQARGIILGSIPADLIQITRDLTIPVILTEGFGEIPMNAQAFRLLLSHNGKEIALMNAEGSGEQLQAGDPHLSEIVIPIGGETAFPTPQPPSYLAVGQSVRLIGYPRLGTVGRISAILELPQQVESGGQFSGVEVETEEGETLFAPWTNVEPIEGAFGVEAMAEGKVK